ncbi:MAG: hypothetical protein ABH827_01755 [bacterium]
MNQKRITLLLASTILTLANTCLVYSEEPQNPNANIIAEQKTPEDQNFSGKKVTELKGYLKILHNEDEISPFRIYYNGMETINNSEGFFSFPLTEGKPNEFTLIISKQIIPQFEKTNTIKNLKLDHTKSYKAYALKAAQFGGFTWEEKKIAHAIPQDSIVILIDPKYVDHLEKWHIEFADNDIHLPQILLKAHKEVKIDHAANKSLLYTLDTKIFHEKITPREKTMEKGTIILPW